MEAFLKLFGNYSISTLTTVIVAGVFVYGVYSKIKHYLIIQYEENKKKDNMIEKTYQKVNEYSTAITELKEKQEEHAKKLEEMDARNRKRELNTTRDRLLQSYRYYNSRDKNPLQAWTAMEAQAFWDMFGDYEELGGNGYLHTEVQPAMNKLEVVEMDQLERIQELFKNRR